MSCRLVLRGPFLINADMSVAFPTLTPCSYYKCSADVMQRHRLPRYDRSCDELSMRFDASSLLLGTALCCRGASSQGLRLLIHGNGGKKPVPSNSGVRVRDVMCRIRLNLRPMPHHESPYLPFPDADDRQAFHNREVPEHCRLRCCFNCSAAGSTRDHDAMATASHRRHRRQQLTRTQLHHWLHTAVETTTLGQVCSSRHCFDHDSIY